MGHIFLLLKKTRFRGGDAGSFGYALYIRGRRGTYYEAIEEARLTGYDLERAQYIQLQIIKSLKNREEASQFVARHIANPRIRRAAIQKAIDDQQYEEAISIAKDGIEHDKKDKPGLIDDWYQYLLEIAQLQNDKRKIIMYARKLFIDGRFEKQPYYDLLKKQVPDAEWTDFVEALIFDIKNKNRWLDFNLIAQSYINEQWWDRLFEWVMEDPGLEKISDYETYLSKDSAAKIAEIYEQEILSLMDGNTGRKYYRKACRFIPKIEKLENKNKARQLVKQLKATYPRRPAMIEELNKLAF